MDATISRIFFPCMAWYLVFPLLHIASGFFGHLMGETRSVGPTGGMLIGFFGGPLGLLVLYTLPVTQKQAPLLPPGGAGFPPPGLPPPPFPGPSQPPAPDFEYACPACGKVYSHQDPSRAGRRVKCVECDEFFTVPGEGGGEPAQREPFAM